MNRYLSHLGLCVLTLTSNIAIAADDSSVFSKGRTFDETGGEVLFESICQGCHMPKGEGASGAGQYPALANNARLISAQYPLHVVVNGQGGMPGFKKYLSDQQIADVVNYVRSHFGNEYDDTVSATDVSVFSKR